MTGFLFGENLPTRLTFTPSLPVVHSTGIAIAANPSDTAVWDHARAAELVIVTKDADFSHRIMLSKPPPWVVHLRFGNVRRKAFHALLAKVWPQVEALLPAHKLVCVYADRIESFRD